MKLARISLSTAAVVVTILGAVAFKNHTSRFLLGTLYTVLGIEHVGCSRLVIGRDCLVSAYTKGHTKVRNAVATIE